MKAVALLISLLSMTGIYLFNQDKPTSVQVSDEVIMKKFVWWKSQYGQNFNGSEEEYRFMEFKNNFLFIQEHNQKSATLTLGLTQFAAMSNSEYRQNVLLKNKVEKRQNVDYYEATGKDIPAVIDWVKAGAVYNTQDQGSCGSCWAFATIGGLQGLRQIVTGTLELLSAQQVTSCVDKQYLDNKNDGCGGGEARYAYNYTSINGIEPASAYPYVDGSPLTKGTSPCEYNEKKVVFYNEGVGYCKENDVDSIKENLVNQPLSIAVDAASIFFQLYKDGVLDSPNCGTDLNHAILMVGMNTEASTPYWTVQNSWGTGWGNKGFGNVAITEGDGVCGINMQVDFPTNVNQKSIIQE